METERIDRDTKRNDWQEYLEWQFKKSRNEFINEMRYFKEDNKFYFPYSINDYGGN